MTTYFDTKYSDVPISSDGIATSEFIQATESVVSLFDLLGRSAFTVVQKDMTGNITLLATGPDVSGTLQLMVKNEGRPGDKKRTATEGLLWLTRGLDFTAKALRRSVEHPEEELSTSFTKAYEASLRQYHGMMVRPLFTACPYRKDFYAKLGSPPERVDTELRDWLASLETIVSDLQRFYE